jgi:protein-disulfide isomerase
MSNTKETKGTAPKSNAPMLIIGLVAVVAIIGGWYYLSTAKTAPKANSNTAANANAAAKPKTGSIPPNAPSGANPPNQAGSQTAAVTLEEFADFQCGACATAHPVMNEIKSMYGSRIRFIFRNFPLAIAAHDKSYEAAIATEAAGMQNKFWDMQNLLFNNQQAWTAAPTYKQIWKEYATKIGLDVAKWESDMAGIGAKSRVDADIARGRAAAVNSTPTLFINGTGIAYGDMNVQALKGIIDAELAKSGPAAPPAANSVNPAATTNAANTAK